MIVRCVQVLMELLVTEVVVANADDLESLDRKVIKVSRV